MINRQFFRLGSARDTMARFYSMRRCNGQMGPVQHPWYLGFRKLENNAGNEPKPSLRKSGGNIKHVEDEGSFTHG